MATAPPGRTSAMRLLTVNVGEPTLDAPRRVRTGIRKAPVLGPVRIEATGVAGDAVLDRKYHGGPDQAAYLYDAADYAWWSASLGTELAPGTFGDNLTTEGVPMTELAIGDHLVVGEVELAVTAPRIPCATLARRMGDPGFVARFLAARRPGAYLRVVRPGAVAAGDPIVLRPHAGDRLGLLELYDDLSHPVLTEAAIRRVLAAPVAARVREAKERQLAARFGGD